MAAVTPKLGRAQRLVVKIGSALLVNGAGLRAEWLRALCDDVAQARARGPGSKSGRRETRGNKTLKKD